MQQRKSFVVFNLSNELDSCFKLFCKYIICTQKYREKYFDKNASDCANTFRAEIR